MLPLPTTSPQSAVPRGDFRIPTRDDTAAVQRRKDRWAVILLLLGAWILHGNGLTLGFWFDDHTHLELCSKNGFRDLAGGNRFDWNGRIAHAWWAQKETGWAYYRPLTVAVRTGLFQLFGLNPVPFHLVHIGLYCWSVVLLYVFLRRCGWEPVFAATAGLFFLVHPVSPFATAWLASDCTVLVGLWVVTGLLLFHASAQAGHRRPLLLAGVFLCYALAMMSRESGIMLGPLLVLFDFLAAWGKIPDTVRQATRRRRWLIYIALALEGVAYLRLRAWSLGAVPLPRNPYFHWPSEPGFLGWLPYKILNDLVCLPLGLPFMPMAEVPWWQSRPLTTVIALLVIVLLVVVFLVPLRRSRVLGGVLGGILLAQAPTLLVFSAPYNYYLAAAGWAVLLAAWTRHFWPTRPRLVLCTTAILLCWYLVGLWGTSWMLHSVATAERQVREDVLATRPEDYPHGTRLFFINMPFFAAESAPALRLTANRPDLEVYPLTFTSEMFFPKTQVEVEPEDAHTLLLRTNGKVLFAGAFGDLVELGWFGASRGGLHLGPQHLDPAAGPMPFRIEVVEADSEGISVLRVVFDRPLDDPGYRFFLGSPRGFAQELRFTLSPSSDGMPFPTHSDSDLIPVVCEYPRERNIVEEREFQRVRRMQMSCDLMVNLLTSWPY